MPDLRGQVLERPRCSVASCCICDHSPGIRSSTVSCCSCSVATACRLESVEDNSSCQRLRASSSVATTPRLGPDCPAASNSSGPLQQPDPAEPTTTQKHRTPATRCPAEGQRWSGRHQDRRPGGRWGRSRRHGRTPTDPAEVAAAAKRFCNRWGYSSPWNPGTLTYHSGQARR